ncbi:Transposase InsO and inactivated derivatives [Gracilimonas mengyeensis]|uniref:Transposase InsO and inactivated derivatives n=1 Tax=Gracilimonas mengyeensis TaxID=1302730 RepID=A0A521CS23_9BACT|nr:Transposase InsO and inactivated derivatives [Gracilimonas mengyeensis]
MADYSHRFPIRKMSQVFGVSPSGYYRWLGRPPSKRARQNRRLKESIRLVWVLSKRIYGAPRIYQELLRRGWQVSRPRVARLMRKMGISSQLRKKWVKTTNSKHSHPVAGNLLDRRFTPTQLNQVWVSDITYLPSQQGWLYLTTVMDLADRQILGWSLSTSMSAEQTTTAAFCEAHTKRPARKGMIFHSDRGMQYACSAFTNLLSKHQLIQSMSRKGNCWDNAPAESFFKTLKAELVSQTGIFRDYQQARAAIFEYIEGWYNRKRLHSSLGYKTPAEAEQELKQKLQQAA